VPNPNRYKIMKTNAFCIQFLGSILFLAISLSALASDCPPGESESCMGHYGACICEKPNPYSGWHGSPGGPGPERPDVYKVSLATQDVCASHPEFNVVSSNGSDAQTVSIDRPAISFKGQCLPLGWGGHLAQGKAVIEGVGTDIFCQQHGFSSFGAFPDAGITTDWGTGQNVGLIGNGSIQEASTYGTPDVNASSSYWVGLVTSVICSK